MNLECLVPCDLCRIAQRAMAVTSCTGSARRLQRLIEFGIPEHLYREQIQHLRKCQMDDFTRPSDALRPLDLGDFYGVFTVYAGGEAKRQGGGGGLGGVVRGRVFYG